jgi:hypothetical protein
MLQQKLFQNGPLSTHMILNALVIALLALDVADIFGRLNFPNTLVRVGCGGLTFTKAAQPFMPSRLVNLASTTCLQPIVSEPTFSIIFFAFKILLVLAATGCVAGNIAPNFHKLRNAQLQSIETNGGLIGSLRNTGVTLLGLALASWYMFLKFDVTPDSFRIDLFEKVLEDLYAVLLFATASSVLWFCTSFIRYALGRKDLFRLKGGQID